MKTRFEEIVNVNAIGGLDQNKVMDAIEKAKNGDHVDLSLFKVATNNELLTLAGAEKVKPAEYDEERVLLLAIDFQNDFMDNGELGVAGSFKDIENTTRFIYNNMEKITQIAVSLDTHQPQQIFHPTWWINDKGEHPAPFTIITAKDVDDGVWRPVGKKPKASIEYVKNLEKQGKKQLCVWTYHCLEGTHGAALEGQFANMVYFHSVARKSVALRLRKGMQAATEMYGIIKAEYDPENKVNYNFLNALEKYDKIVIVGEAKSHCVLESISQILDYYKDREDVRRKIYILEDCMSSIQGFEDSTEEAFKEFKNKFSVNITKSTDLVL